MAMSTALDSARLKVGRAEQHIGELEHEIHAYLASHPFEFLRQLQAGNPNAVSVHISVPPPAYLSCIVGDAVYNSRAALELIYWSLALETGPKDPDRDRISFPIFADESKFAAAQDGFERYLPSGAIEAIEAVQPFRTRNASLSVLRTLSNQDKHGFLALTVVGMNGRDGPSAVAFRPSPKLPTGAVDVLLHRILQHITREVLPKFEPLFS
jgi:hypothetical protein